MSGEHYCKVHGYRLTCGCQWVGSKFIPEEEVYQMKSFDQIYDEDEKKKFQRRNLLARMAGNILAGAAVKLHDHGGSSDELAEFAVDLAKRVLDKLEEG